MKKANICRVIFLSIFFSIVSLQANFSQTTYCASKGNQPWELWITNVTLNSIKNSSEKYKDYATFGYSDYTNVTTLITKGQSYNLSVTPGLSWSGIQQNAFCKIWIDYNRNNIFEDGEQVFSDTNKYPFTGSVIIPTAATSGTTRMRVAMKYGNFPISCETFDKGEVEDYTVTIQESVSYSCRAQDSLQLVILYNATNGANWTNKWDLTQPVNTWYGIGLNDKGCVFTIDLSANNLSGTLPNLSFPNLIELYLGFNKLTGNIPVLNTPSMVYLDLSSNQLNGSIPNFNLPSLIKLFLENNQLSGCIPVALKSLCGKQIDVSNNPNLATQDFASFCSNNTGACVVSKLNLTLTGFNVITSSQSGLGKLNQGETVHPIDGSLVGTNLPPTPISFKIKVYISTDQIIDANDYLLSQYTATIQPNFTQTDFLQEGGWGILAANTKIPADFPLGNYYLIVKIDADNEIDESNENDNLDIIPIQIVPSISSPTDLLGLSISSNPASYRQFSSLTFTISAANNSTSPISNVKIKFPFPPKIVTGGNAIASSGTWNEFCPGGVHCYEWNIPTLAPNSKAMLNVPVYIQDFTGNIVVIADLVSATPPQSANVPHISATLSIPPATGFLIGQNNVLELSANADFDKVNLTWLSNQSNTDYFEIQRADAANDFQKIGTHTGNNTAGITTYNYSETGLNEGVYTYRIKQINLDGSEKLSDIQTVKVGNLNGVQVFPNPVTDELSITLKNYSGNTEVLIYNNLGIVVQSAVYKNASSVEAQNIATLPTGNFFLRVVSNGKRDVIKSFIIAR